MAEHSTRRGACMGTCLGSGQFIWQLLQPFEHSSLPGQCIIAAPMPIGHIPACGQHKYQDCPCFLTVPCPLIPTITRLLVGWLQAWMHE